MKRSNSKKITFDVIYDLFCKQFGCYDDVKFSYCPVAFVFFLDCCGDRICISSVIIEDLIKFCAKFNLVFSIHSEVSRPRIMISKYED